MTEEKKKKSKAPDISIDLREKMAELHEFTSELKLAEFFGGDIKLVRKTLIKMWQVNTVIRSSEQEHDPRQNTHFDRWTLTEFNTDGVTYPMYVKAVHDEELQSMAVAIGTRLNFVMMEDYRKHFKGNDEVLSKLKTTPQAWVEAVRRCLDDALVKGDIEL